MVVYVVCAESAWDSYHSLILVTLDKTEAEEKVNNFNAKHDEECTVDNLFSKGCFCIRYHAHETPLKGITDKVRRLSGLTA